jgi:hypothetical protein
MPSIVREHASRAWRITAGDAIADTLIDACSIHLRAAATSEGTSLPGDPGLKAQA